MFANTSRPKSLILAAVFMMSLFVLGACGDDNDGGQSCDTGTAGCECYGNDTCDDGSQCVSGVCEASGQALTCTSDGDCGTGQLCHFDADECVADCTDDESVCSADQDCLARSLSAGGELGVKMCVAPEEGGFPEIVSMTVSPASIPQSEVGMSDKTLDVTITIADFAGQITSADLFVQLQGEERQAPADDFTVEGNSIDLLGVPYSSFQGLEPGDYQLGAKVVSDAGEQVQTLDLATVTITP